MYFHLLTREGCFELGDMPPFLAGILRQLPESARSRGSPGAERRLYSSPTSDPTDPLADDWREHVAPELRRLFESAIEIAQHDLDGLQMILTVPGDPKASSATPQPAPTMEEVERLLAATPGLIVSFRLRIPLSNADAWISALNQARLVLAESIGYSEADHGRSLADRRLTDRDFELIKIELYGEFLAWIVEAHPLRDKRDHWKNPPE